MRHLSDIYPAFSRVANSKVMSVDDYFKEIDLIQLQHGDLTLRNFKPGSSSESAFYKVLSGKVEPEELFNKSRTAFCREAPWGCPDGDIVNSPLWLLQGSLDGGGLGEESEDSSARAQGVKGEPRTITLIRWKPPAEALGPGAGPRAKVRPNRDPHGAGVRSV